MSKESHPHIDPNTQAAIDLAIEKLEKEGKVLGPITLAAALRQVGENVLGPNDFGIKEASELAHLT